MKKSKRRTGSTTSARTSSKRLNSKATTGRTEAMYEDEDVGFRASSGRDSEHYESSRGESYGPGSFYGGEGYGRSGGYGRAEQFSRNQSERGDSYGPYRDDQQSRRQSYGRDESEREFSRGSRSPGRETYDTDRNSTYRGSSRNQDYGWQGRENSEREYNDYSRMNPRGSQYGSHRGYNEGSYSDRDQREERYGSAHNRNYEERSMNNYDNQDEYEEDDISYRLRYNENRY